MPNIHIAILPQAQPPPRPGPPLIHLCDRCARISSNRASLLILLPRRPLLLFVPRLRQQLPRAIPLDSPKPLHPRPRQEPRLHSVRPQELFPLRRILNLRAAAVGHFLRLKLRVQLPDEDELADGLEGMPEEVRGVRQLIAEVRRRDE